MKHIAWEIQSIKMYQIWGKKVQKQNKTKQSDQSP